MKLNFNFRKVFGYGNCYITETITYIRKNIKWRCESPRSKMVPKRLRFVGHWYHEGLRSGDWVKVVTMATIHFLLITPHSHLHINTKLHKTTTWFASVLLKTDPLSDAVQFSAVESEKRGREVILSNPVFQLQRGYVGGEVPCKGVISFL